MSCEGYNFYSAEEVIIAYNEGRVDLHAFVNVRTPVLEDGKLVITRVIPEGKNEMTYDDFLRGSQ